MSFLRSKEGPLHLLDVFKMSPERAKLIFALHELVMRGPSPFSVAERELIFAYGSGVNACQYCHNAHKYTAAGFGIDEGLFERLLDNLDSAPVDQRLKPVLRYVRKLTETPSRLTDADADAVYAAGWDEQALLDAVTVCALHNFMNRLVDGMGVDVGEDAWREAGERLSTVSYAGSSAKLFGS